MCFPLAEHPFVLPLCPLFWSRAEVLSIPACSLLHSLLVRGSVMNHTFPKSFAVTSCPHKQLLPLPGGVLWIVGGTGSCPWLSLVLVGWVMETMKDAWGFPIGS